MSSKTIPLSLHLILSSYIVTLLTPFSLAASPKSIFLLAGQSNMAGRGGVINNSWDGIVPGQCRAHPLIFRLNAHLQWVEAHEPLHRDIDTNHTCGVGPGMSFVNTLLSKGSPRMSLQSIGLVPCAVGGTTISQWSRGGYLYKQLVRRAFASLREGGTIEAFIWYQGESDTIVRQDSWAYKRRLERLFADLRDELQSPMLPIIQVAIASGEGPFVETVRQAQMGIDLLNLKTVDAKGLPLEPDHLHLTAPAQVHLGERLAYAFLQFLPSRVDDNNGLQISTSNKLFEIPCHFNITALLLIAALLQNL